MVEFEPETAKDVQLAKQATEYVNFIWTRDNPGFLNMYSWFTDALLSKNGIVKIWWDDTPIQKRESYRGLDDQAFAKLVNGDDVEVSEHTEREEEIQLPDMPNPTGQGIITPPPIKIKVHDVVVTREMDGGRVCVVPVPPEEFLISHDARSICEARFVGHRRRRTLSDLIEEGYPESIVDRLTGDESGPSNNAEELSRNTVETEPFTITTTFNSAMRQVWVTEGYCKIDVDGDGIAEWRQVTVAGSGFEVLQNDAWDAPLPFANLTPIILPHRFTGMAIADQIRDLQLIKSTIMRQYLDNLYLANNQREEVVENAIIDPQELLSSTPGAKIRVKVMGSIKPIPVPDIGRQALEGLQYIDQVKENRTGVSQRTQGLGANQLHETAAGERMLMSAAMGKIELIARVFAETGVKDAFKLILKLVNMYQDKPRMIRLDDNFVEMDPSTWNADMDVRISVGMGTGDKDQQLQHALLLGQLQQAAGQSGLVHITPENAMATAEMVINAMGLKGVERFFTMPDPQAQAATPPSPEMVKAQGHAQAAQSKAQSTAQVLQFKAQADAQHQQQKVASDTQAAQTKAATDLQIQQQKLTYDFLLKHYQIGEELNLKRQEMQAEIGLKQQLQEQVHLGGEPG